MDPTDRRILETLRRDGRMSMRMLAESVHISRANAYARVERLQRAGVIRGFRAQVDPVRSGLSTSAYITVNLQQSGWRGIRERLQAIPGVVHIALVGGDFDAVLLVRAHDNAALRRVVLEQIQQVEGVTGTRTLLILEESEPSAGVQS
ncbi:Lrp/AsnC family transcriptional regulator [Nocardioides sp. MAHUQ-72]|uniref:Lrp/AsnC family transcriptional regulator n=1 Tax=unclassified Nocardioides TaxID=2615069 RepID=UPI00361C4959